MKIALSAHGFSPAIGGTEEVSLILAEEFHRAGHEVQVLTRTAETDAGHPFPVLRRPGPREQLAAVRWCHVYFHNNISLRVAWPLLWVRRPWVVAHHIWLTRPDGRIAWRDHWKRRVIRRATNIAVSRAIAEALPVACTVLPNPYRDDVFRELPETQRDGELIFVGRLVSDKGLDLLLHALLRLRAEGLQPQLTIVGDGPERQALEGQVAAGRLRPQVTFTGARRQVEVAEILNRHRILVVPSRWSEPFGLVALEGAACGCVVVGADGGGLPDAIGPCGLLFARGNPEALAEVLRSLLRAPDRLASYRAAAPGHLARHRRAVVAAGYLSVLRAACRAPS